MINVLVYNHIIGIMEKHVLDPNNPMPYTIDRTLLVREFRGKSDSNVLWTDRRTMQAWNKTRYAWGKPIQVSHAFRRIGEGGHPSQSQHYAGTAFDMAQNLDPTARDQLRNLANKVQAWGYIGPANLTPTWIHMDARLSPPACAAGYPLVRQGSVGVYVAALQDALGAVGIPAVGIDGIFGPETQRGVLDFQKKNNLPADAIVGCRTWTALTATPGSSQPKIPQIFSRV